MAKPKLPIVLFIGLNALRLISLLVIILVFTTLIMGLVEDIRDYHDSTNMDEAQADDCAYVPGTSIPMQTWGIFWVEVHRSLLLIGTVALSLAELSWLSISKLERAVQLWFPVLSRDRGLAALGSVQIVVATSLLSHYLDEFPLVVSWMLFVIGMCYLCLGIAFHSSSLKDARSCFSQKRSEFGKKARHSFAPRSALKELKAGGEKHTGSEASMTLRNLFSRKGGQGKRRGAPVSIHESFPSLEAKSHRDVLADRARRAEHRRKTSSVAVDMSTLQADTSSITRDFMWDVGTGIVHERGREHGHGRSQSQTTSDTRRDSRFSEQSFSAASIASSTQIRIGGYTSREAARARERAKQRRAGNLAGSSDERAHPPPARSTGQSSKTAIKIKSAKRRSLAFVNGARYRLSAGTASALAARRRASSQKRRSIPNADSDIVIEYIDDANTAPPVPPLPAYHQVSGVGETVALPVASRFARTHVV